MISRMRIVSLPHTIACADKIMLTIIDTYFSPNQSARELRDLVRVGAGIDPLRDFSEVARDELRLFKYRYTTQDATESAHGRVTRRTALDARWARLHDAGVVPEIWRKFLQRWAWSVNPHRNAMSVRDAPVCSMYCLASFSRRRIKNACGESPKVRLSRLHCRSHTFRSMMRPTLLATQNPKPLTCLFSAQKISSTDARLKLRTGLPSSSVNKGDSGNGTAWI